MSIVRVGLSETDGFADGYDAIFGKKKKEAEKAKSEPKPSEPKDGEKTEGEQPKK